MHQPHRRGSMMMSMRRMRQSEPSRCARRQIVDDTAARTTVASGQHV